MAGWAVYLLCGVWTSAFSVVGAAFAAALVITVLSHLLAVLMRAPVTIAIAGGIILAAAVYVKIMRKKRINA